MPPNAVSLIQLSSSWAAGVRMPLGLTLGHLTRHRPILPPSWRESILILTNVLTPLISYYLLTHSNILRPLAALPWICPTGFGGMAAHLISILLCVYMYVLSVMSVDVYICIKPSLDGLFPRNLCSWWFVRAKCIYR